MFGGRETEPTKHLGEAMTLVLIETREELRGSWWVTDDREAAEHADRKGITTRDTMHIMGELVSEGTLTAVDTFALTQTSAIAIVTCGCLAAPVTCNDSGALSRRPGAVTAGVPSGQRRPRSCSSIGQGASS